MLPETVAWPSGRPRWITSYDARRSYLLPEQVETNIPRRGYLGSYGAHDWARGHLVELHRRLGGVPLSLHYRELLTRLPHEDPKRVPEHLPVGNEVTAVLRDPDGQLVTVITRDERAPYGPRGDYWEVSVNGEIPVDGDDPALTGHHAYPPSLPFLAFLVQLHLRHLAQRQLAPVIPLRP
ncbi:hypothetical protein [Amycolatopsis magusensis]|uniref:hypothetical protein n=1 Tax=Amycolatopsis magusensis TaxID=882444 RepID=UPI0037BACD64